MMRRIVPLLFLLIPLAAAAGDDEAVFDKISIEYQIFEDGTYTEHVVRELTFQSTYSAMKAQEDGVIIYNPENQELVINSSYLRKPDGTVVMTPDDKLVSGDGKYAVLLEGVEPGYKSIIDYILVTYPKDGESFCVKVPLEYRFPVSLLEISVMMPSSRMLSYDFSLDTAIPYENSAGGTRTTRWTFKNVKELPVDPGEWKRSELLLTTGPVKSDKDNLLAAVYVRRNAWSFDLSVSEADMKNGFVVLTLPFADGGFNGEPYATYPTERNRELITGRPISESCTYRIVLGDGVRPDGLGCLDYEISNGTGYCSSRASVEGNVITVYRSLDIFEPVIAASDFKAFHELVAVWACNNHIQLTTRIAEGITSTVSGVMPAISPSISINE